MGKFPCKEKCCVENKIEWFFSISTILYPSTQTKISIVGHNEKVLFVICYNSKNRVIILLKII